MVFCILEMGDPKLWGIGRILDDLGASPNLGKLHTMGKTGSLLEK